MRTFGQPRERKNVVELNYTNVNNFSGKSFDIPSFTAEKAKPEGKLNRKFETSTDLLALPKSSSSEVVTPKASTVASLKEEDEVQVQPLPRRKQSKIYEKREEAFISTQGAQMLGMYLITLAACIFIGVFYSVIISPLVGETGHVVLDLIRLDNYYCFLAPLMIPASLGFIYANWVSVKFFRHT